ncbi:MAG: DUF4492 domain-containing protein [Bacteroidales bacterium]|nr:DUF4492 domain-containing protein [Bacteroidales bacterium]
MRSIFNTVFRYCVNGIKIHAIGLSAVIFAITTFLILFLFLKPYFFPNFLETKFETDEERSSYVIDQLTR